MLGRHEVWLAGSPGAVEGALCLTPAPDHLLIWSVATHPRSQGKQLGRRLLAAAEARARDLGLSQLRLYTGEKLVKNIGWYERRGYATARVETLPDRRIVHMSKNLDS